MFYRRHLSDAEGARLLESWQGSEPCFQNAYHAVALNVNVCNISCESYHRARRSANEVSNSFW